MRCDFSGRRMSEQHQRRKWDKPPHGHDPQSDKDKGESMRDILLKLMLADLEPA